MANLIERQIGPGPVPVWDIQTASASQIDACCGLGRGVNLFDNWWFGIGAINQRGKTTYPASTVVSYGIDRWFMAPSSTITWESDGLLIDSNYIGQIQDPILREYLTGKVVTMSALVKGNAGDIGEIMGNLIRFPASSEFQLVTITFTYRGGSNTAAKVPIISPLVAGAPIKVLAMGLEIGPISTLAHKEGDTWALNSPPPNYYQELEKCQKYYRKLLYHPMSICYMPGYISGFGFPRMRAAPSISFKAQDPIGNVVNPVPQQIRADGVDYFDLDGASPWGTAYVFSDIVLNSEL